VLAAALLIAQATAPSALSYATWGAITLGSPAATLRPMLGDPLRILLYNDGKSRVARYWLPGSDSTYVIVIEERGYIIGYDIFVDAAPTGTVATVAPDPLGVRLGDTLASVKSQHAQLSAHVDDNGAPILVGRISPSIAVVYSLQDDRVQSIHWLTSISPEKPDLTPLTADSGDAISSAIVDAQRTERDGVAWEYRYLAYHPCTESVRWQLQSQALLRQNGRAYDRLHVVCPATEAQRDFFFDISSYFGKD
jgi:hypothetical protein